MDQAGSIGDNKNGDDIERGPIFRLNTDSYDNDIDSEPIPDLTIGDGDATNDGTDGSTTRSSLASSIPSNSGVIAATDHTVINRMTTMEYLWRRHVRSRTTNVRVQAMLDRILLVFLFLASIVEQPLMYLLGNTQQQQPTNNNKPKPFQTPVTKGTVKTGLGVIAYTISQGRNPKKNPILCFHAEGRSSDEYLEMLPLLADTGRRVVALDLPGHGWSENPRKSCNFDDMADAVLKVADTLLIEQFVCLGNSMGTLICTSLASRYPNRVRGCILVNILYYPPSVNEKQLSNNAKISGFLSTSDDLIYKDDGTHLLDLHNRRKFLDPDLNLRCIQSDLTRLVNLRARQVDGITMEDVSHYDLEHAARTMRCPTLCVGGEAALASLDARGLGGTQRFDTACRLLPHCEVNSLTGPRSTLYLMNQASKEFTSLCAGFLEKHSL